MAGNWKLSALIAAVAILAYVTFSYVTSPRYFIGQAATDSGLLIPLVSNTVFEETLEGGVKRSEHYLAVPSLVVGGELDPTIPATLDLFITVFENPKVQDGTTVIFVHGGPAAPLDPIPMDTTNALLAGGKVRKVVFYHARGCGKSERPFDKMDESLFVLGHLLTIERALGLGAQIADIERIRRFVTDGLTNQKVAIVGFSFGGFVAPLYAAEFPQHVKALYLVAPAPLMKFPPADGKDLFGLIREALSAVQHGDGTLDSIADLLESTEAKDRLHTMYSNATVFDNFVNNEYMNTLKTLKRSDRLVQCMSLDLGLFYAVASGYTKMYVQFDKVFETSRCPRLGSSTDETALMPIGDAVWQRGGGWAQLASFLSLGIFSSFGDAIIDTFHDKLQGRPAPFCTTVLHTNKDLATMKATSTVFNVMPPHLMSSIVSVDATHFVFNGEETSRVIETGEEVSAHIARSIKACL